MHISIPKLTEGQQSACFFGIFCFLAAIVVEIGIGIIVWVCSSISLKPAAQLFDITLPSDFFSGFLFWLRLTLFLAVTAAIIALIMYGMYFITIKTFNGFIAFEQRVHDAIVRVAQSGTDGQNAVRFYITCSVWVFCHALAGFVILFFILAFFILLWNAALNFCAGQSLFWNFGNNFRFLVDGKVWFTCLIIDFFCSLVAGLFLAHDNANDFDIPELSPFRQFKRFYRQMRHKD